MPEKCPCCSGKEYSACCEPLIKGERNAATAAELLQSRYTAFTKGEIDYIENTIYPSKRNDFDRDGARKWAEESIWQGLEIEDTVDGKEEDKTGTVTFTASFKADGEYRKHRENAQFKKKNETWYFVDGKAPQQDPYTREEPKLGRNDPCHCGSGKKFKKCCMGKN